MNCIPVPRNGVAIPFFWVAGRRSPPPGWLCYSQKRGTSSQSWTDYTCTPVIWICDKTNLNQMEPHTHHILGSSEMHTVKTKKRHNRLEMHYSHTHTTHNNNTKPLQHNNPLTTKQHTINKRTTTSSYFKST